MFVVLYFESLLLLSNKYNLELLQCTIKTARFCIYSATTLITVFTNNTFFFTGTKTKNCAIKSKAYIVAIRFSVILREIPEISSSASCFLLYVNSTEIIENVRYMQILVLDASN